MVNFKEIYHFSRFQRGSNIFQGGPTFSSGGGGSNCLFPIETHITCDFPGRGGPDPLSPLWIRTCLMCVNGNGLSCLSLGSLVVPFSHVLVCSMNVVLVGGGKTFQFVTCGLQWQTDKNRCLTEACTKNRKHKMFFGLMLFYKAWFVQMKHYVEHVTMKTGVQIIADPLL